MIKEPRFRASISVTLDNKNYNFPYVDEKPKELMDRFMAVLGDGNASISVSTDFGIKSFGNGVSAMVTVTLSCGQNNQQINDAAELAAQAARYYAKKFQAEGESELRRMLESQGRKAEF